MAWEMVLTGKFRAVNHWKAFVGEELFSRYEYLLSGHLTFLL